MSREKPFYSELINSAAHNDGFIRQKTLLKDHVPFSAATLWRLIAAGKFPKPIKLSSNIIAWSRSSVLSWAKDPAGYVATSQTGAQQ